jgi:AcrR family transcriptional regulator
MILWWPTASGELAYFCGYVSPAAAQWRRTWGANSAARSCGKNSLPPVISTHLVGGGDGVPQPIRPFRVEELVLCEAVDRRIDRGRATREDLIAVATELFAARGYEGTSTEAVLEQAGVSRGSMYHHFGSKERLFEAVVERVHGQVGEATLEATAAVGDADARTLLRTGYLAWVRLAGEPVVRRILLIDAPTVLGWRRWRQMEEQYGLGMLKEVLQGAVHEGRLVQELSRSRSRAAVLVDAAVRIRRTADHQLRGQHVYVRLRVRILDSGQQAGGEILGLFDHRLPDRRQVE